MENPSKREEREGTASKDKSISKYEEAVVVNDSGRGKMGRLQSES